MAKPNVHYVLQRGGGGGVSQDRKLGYNRNSRNSGGHRVTRALPRHWPVSQGLPYLGNGALEQE